MPKDISGAKHSPPLTFKWGTFCRQVVVDANNPLDFSLIGVLTKPKMSFESTSDHIEFPTSIWVHAEFDVNIKVEAETTFKLSMRLARSDREPHVTGFDVKISPGQDILAVNIQLLLGPDDKSAGLRLVDGGNFIQASFKYKSSSLGMVELPIAVTLNKKV